MAASIIDFNIIALESILKSKDTLMAMALHNFELKRSELWMKLKSADNLNEEMATINKELEQAKKVVEQPFVQGYINLGMIKDVNAAIEHLKSSKATRTEEEERLQTLAAYRTIGGKSREEAKEHLSKMLALDVADYTEELQIVIMDAWAWKLYYSTLLQAKRDLASQIQAEDSATDEGKGKAKIKQLDTSQLVLMILLLDEVYTLNSKHNTAGLIEFICALTGRDGSNIKKFIEKARNGDFEIHGSHQKNLEDFMAIRPFFDGLGLKKIVKKIDDKIYSIKAFIKK